MRLLDEQRAGIGQRGRAGIADQRHILARVHDPQKLGGGGALVVLVQCNRARRDGVPREQRAAGSRVLAGDQIGGAQRFDRAPAGCGAPLPGRAPGRALPLRRVSHRRRRRARAVDPQRLRRVALLAALLAAGPVRADERAPSVRLLVQSSPLAGFRYHAAAEVWDQLRVGDALELRREPDNPHDPGAVSIAWRGRKLGYVPRRENAALAWGLDRGEPLRARISRLAPHPNPARRVEFEVYFE